MTKGEKYIGRWSRGSGPNKHPPQRLVAKALALAALVQPLILLFDAVAATTPASMLALAQEAQAVAGACPPQHPSCRRPRPLQALLGEAAVLGWRRLAVVIFSPSTLGTAAAPAVGILHAGAQGRHEQQPDPQGEKLPLASHFPWKKERHSCFS